MAHAFLNDFDAWGPPFWKVAHAITFDYPEANPTKEQKERVERFFAMMPWFLPCGVCGSHFINTVATQHPFSETTTAGRDALSRWLVDVHNTVNTRLKKPTVPYDQVYRYFLVDARTPLRSCERTCPASQRDGLAIALAVVIVGIAGLGVGAAVLWNNKKPS